MNYLFGFSIMVQKNRMIQIESCDPAYKQTLLISQIMLPQSEVPCYAADKVLMY